MSKKTKIWLITAASFVLIGTIIFAGVMTMLKWDFTKLNTVKYETNTYEIDENFNNITINTKTTDIVFVPSDDENCKIVCYEQKKVKHSVTVQNETLEINVNDTRKWYEYIGITFGTSKITVYVPQSEYAALSIKSSTGNVEIPKNFKFESIDISLSTGDVRCMASTTEQIKIKTSTGDIHIENASAKGLDLSVSTGKVTASSVTCNGDVKVVVSTGDTVLTDVTCKNISSYGSTGDITLKNVIAGEAMNINRSTGDVKLEKCDADEISIQTDTGDVIGSLLTDKVFITQTDTGSINVPKTVTGGRCEITTDTGNIKINIQ